MFSFCFIFNSDLNSVSQANAQEQFKFDGNYYKMIVSFRTVSETIQLTNFICFYQNLLIIAQMMLRVKLKCSMMKLLKMVLFSFILIFFLSIFPFSNLLFDFNCFDFFLFFYFHFLWILQIDWTKLADIPLIKCENQNNDVDEVDGPNGNLKFLLFLLWDYLKQKWMERNYNQTRI